MIFLATLELSQLLGILAGLFIAIIALSFFLYIYSSLAIMTIAKRTGTSNSWLAWIPYANFYLISKISQSHWWPILLLLVPVLINLFPSGAITSIILAISLGIFMIFNIVWWWKICERRGKPGWWVLIGLIPVIGWIWGLILIGILAWGKNGDSSALETSTPLTQKLNN